MKNIGTSKTEGHSNQLLEKVAWRTRRNKLHLFFAAGIYLLVATTSPAALVLIDLGYHPTDPVISPDAEGRYWNSIPTWNPYAKSGLVDSSNAVTAIAWQTVTKFNNYYTDGVSESDYFPSTVSKYGINLLSSGASTAQVLISGLDSAQSYSFTFYGSFSAAAVGSNRAMTFSVAGVGDPASGTLFVPKGTEDTLVLAGLTPNSSGVISIDASLPAGTSTGYWGALEIESIPEPGTIMFAIFAVAFLWVARKGRLGES